MHIYNVRQKKQKESQLIKQTNTQSSKESNRRIDNFQSEKQTNSQTDKNSNRKRIKQKIVKQSN